MDIHSALSNEGKEFLAKEFLKSFNPIEVEMVVIDPTKKMTFVTNELHLYQFTDPTKPVGKGEGMISDLLIYNPEINIALLFTNVRAFCHAGLPGITTLYATPDYIASTVSTRRPGHGFRIGRGDGFLKLETLKATNSKDCLDCKAHEERPDAFSPCKRHGSGEVGANSLLTRLQLLYDFVHAEAGLGSMPAITPSGELSADQVIEWDETKKFRRLLDEVLIEFKKNLL